MKKNMKRINHALHTKLNDVKELTLFVLKLSPLKNINFCEADYMCEAQNYPIFTVEKWKFYWI